ncbi:hypothetical protein ACF1BU_06055 [Streptomyces sp. NPDC014724]|uniref:hypothetical protein n=1 Tax=unclassified Streptomyces TaxID=2593676 RepID=UPI0036FB8879
MLTSTFSVTEWWMAAVVSGIALAVAAQSMATTRRDKLIAVSLPLVGAVCIAVNSAARGYTGPTPLMLYTATAMGLAVLRVIFAKYVRRQLDLKHAGKPMEVATGKQTAIFLLTFAAVVMAMAVIL